MSATDQSLRSPSAPVFKNLPLAELKLTTELADSLAALKTANKAAAVEAIAAPVGRAEADVANLRRCAGDAALAAAACERVGHEAAHRADSI